MGTTAVHDLCLCWNWEHDADFAGLLEAVSRSRGLSLLQITPDNLEQSLEGMQRGQIAFRVLLDRASDTDERFLAVVQWARRHEVRCLNPHGLARRAWDKAVMHRALDAALHTPATIILPPYAEQADLTGLDLGPLGGCFNIKPAHGGGGEGVVIGATSLEQVFAARQERPTDRYLLQSHVVPARLAERPAWFRVIYCAGEIWVCWWDTQSHVYTPVTPAEEADLSLGPLRAIAAFIARASGLDLFSSEIALVPDGRFVIVDYVNDPIDLRLQSATPEGVPDHIVLAIAERLAAVALEGKPL